jgi:hypothetical protein
MRRCSWLLSAVAGLAAPAFAGEDVPSTVLEIGPNSSATLAADTLTFIGSASDTDITMGVTGQIELASSDFSDPGDLQLIDLSITLDPAPITSSFIDGGEFLGTAGPMTLSIGTIDLDPQGKPKKIESGIASFSIPVAITGEASATYDLIGIEPADGTTVDLSPRSTPRPARSSRSSRSQFQRGRDHDRGALFFNTVNIPFEPGLVEINLSSANMSTSSDRRRSWPTPRTFCSRADIADDCGVLDLADIVAFVQGFTAQDPDLRHRTATPGLTSGHRRLRHRLQQRLLRPQRVVLLLRLRRGYAAIEFHEGNSAYAFGDHSVLTAGIAVSGAALMLGFGSFRRKHA